MILTSNRTRDLHDALKRRCLYHWIGYPDLRRAVAIIRRRVPASTMSLAAQVAAAVDRLRTLDIQKAPGIAEAINWTLALDLLSAALRGSLGATDLAGRDLAGRDLAGFDLAAAVAGLAQLLHQAGIPVSPDRAGRLAVAVSVASPATNDELYWLGRVTLASTPTETELYDRVFRQVFRGIWDPADFRGDSNILSSSSTQKG